MSAFIFMETRTARMRPAPEGLRERNKREKVARIKRAAGELFAKKGFEGATAREICRRARIATGTLFLYARDKRELLFLVFSDEVRNVLQERTVRSRADRPLADALMHLFGGMLDFYARSPELSRAIAGEFFYRTEEPARMRALTREYLDGIAALVERACARGELRTDVPVAEQANAFFAHYAFYVLAWLGGAASSRRQTEQALRRAITFQIEGLTPRSPRWQSSRRGQHHR